MARAGPGSDGDGHGGAGPSSRGATIGGSGGSSSSGGWRIRVLVKEDVLQQAARVRGRIVRRGGVRSSRRDSEVDRCSDPAPSPGHSGQRNLKLAVERSRFNVRADGHSATVTVTRCVQPESRSESSGRGPGGTSVCPMLKRPASGWQWQA